MNKASDFETENWAFEAFSWSFNFIKSANMDMFAISRNKALFLLLGHCYSTLIILDCKA